MGKYTLISPSGIGHGHLHLTFSEKSCSEETCFMSFGFQISHTLFSITLVSLKSGVQGACVGSMDLCAIPKLEKPGVGGGT